MKRALVALVMGVLFALGLGLAGMTQPGKVVGFLDVTGDWDPSLAFVMVGAIAVYALAHRLRLRKQAPVLGGQFPRFDKQNVDKRLLAGAALFGAGWGLAGYCPGPALTSLVSGAPQVLVFVAAMLGSMWLARRAERAGRL